MLPNSFDVKVLFDSFGSDHRPIWTKLSIKKGNNQASTAWASTHGNIASLKSDLKLANTLCSLSLSKSNMNFTPTSAWLDRSSRIWSESITVMKRRKRKWAKKLKALREKGLEESHEQIVLAKSKRNFFAKRARKAAKNLEKKTRTSKQSRLQEELSMWRQKKLVRKKGHIISIIMDSGSNSITDKKEILRLLLDHHYPSQEVLQDELKIGDIRPATSHEIEMAISKTNTKKSNRQDLFKDDLIKRLLRDRKYVLSQMVNEYLTKPSEHKDLNTSIVTFIPKNLPKQGVPSVSNFRPISSPSVLMKVKSNVIKTRLEAEIFQCKHLHTSIYGSLDARTSQDVLAHMVNEVHSLPKSRTAVVAFDIQGAFGSTKWTLVKEAMTKHNLNQALINESLSTLSHRWLSAGFDDHWVEKPMALSLPQGDVTSPILFSLVMSLALKRIQRMLDKFIGQEVTVTPRAYVDDLSCVIRAPPGSNPPANDFKKKVNKVIQIISVVFSKMGYQISNTKSKVVLINQAPTPLTGIESSSIANILGLTIDTRMTFLPHARAITTKVEEKINSEEDSKLSFHLRKTLMEKSLLKIALYGIEIWWPFASNEAKEQFEIAMNKITTFALNATLTINKDVKKLLLGIPPTRILVHNALLLRKARWNMSFTKDDTQYKLVLKKRIRPTSSPLTARALKVTRDIATPGSWPNQLENKILIFTDASLDSTTHLAGMAAVAAEIAQVTNVDEQEAADFVEQQNAKHISWRSKVIAGPSTAESLAILGALKNWTLLSHIPKQQVKAIQIFTDSKSTIDALGNTCMQNNIISTICDEVHQLNVQGIDVEFTWIKGHAHIGLNEVADYLSKKAITQAVTGQSVISIGCLKKTLNKEMEYLATTWYTENWRPYLDLFFENPRQAFENNYKWDSGLIYLVTGKGPPFLMVPSNHEDSHAWIKSCVCDPGVRRTVPHLIFECPATSSIFNRRDLLSLMEKENITTKEQVLRLPAAVKIVQRKLARLFRLLSNKDAHI
jgi:ribonuclease HI